MGQLIVIPERAWVERGAVQAGQGASSRRNTRAMQAARKPRLHELAAMALAKGPTRARAERRAGGVEVDEPEGYAVLEGIGVMLLDERLAPRETVARRTNALVLPNMPIAHVASEDEARAPRPEGSPRFWHLEHINVLSLWNRGVKGAGVTVGILDSGIQASHPEFEGKRVHFAAFDKDGKLTGTEAKDFGQHGTHVSGVVAGKSAGVAPEASLAVAAVLTERGKGHFAQILAGLNWLVTTAFGDDEDDVGCHLINAALEVPGYKDIFYAAIAAAAENPGTLTVAAVGNFGTTRPGLLASPGNYDIVVGVGATDPDDRVTAFSQWGTVAQHGGMPKPDLCAPGTEILSSVPYDRYNAQSGTSMASPVVCGAAALLLQQEPALMRDVPALRKTLLEQVVPLPEQGPKAGHGRLRLGL